MLSVNYCRIVNVVLHRADIFRAEEEGNKGLNFLCLAFIVLGFLLSVNGEATADFDGFSLSREFLCRKEKRKKRLCPTSEIS